MTDITELNQYGVLVNRPLTPTENEQLSVLLEAFEKFVVRNRVYQDLWKKGGAEDSAHHVHSKSARIQWMLEIVRNGGELDPDDALDLINYSAFFLRNARSGRLDGGS